MPTTFGHGRGFGALLNGRDLTRVSTDFNYATDFTQDEQTCSQAPGGAKEFMYALLGTSAGLDGRVAKSLSEVQRYLAATYGQEDDPKLFLLAPFGFAPGNWGHMFRTRKQTQRINGGLTSVVGTGGTFQGDNSSQVGRMLQASRLEGNGSLSLPDVQRLIWSGVDPNQFFAFRANGTTALSANFQLSTYISSNVVNTTTLSAFIKAQVEAMAAFTGRTVTITVVTPFTVSNGLWSGALQLAFNGTVNLPQLEPVSGAVRRAVVINGDGGNYTFDGGANLTLGITQANYQLNQRAIDAAHAGVITIGSSTAPVSSLATSYIVAGLTTYPALNGTYTDTGTLYAGRPVFRMGATSNYLFWNGTNWGIGHAAPLTSFDYQGPTTATPDNSNYGSPGATVTAGGGATTTPGTLDFTSYFPVTGAPTAPTKTGTGATNTSLVPAGTLVTTFTAQTTQEGGTITGVNPISSAFTGTAVQTTTAPHTNGATIDQHAPFVSLGTVSVPVIVEHAPDASGSPGAWSTLGTFTTITDGTNDAQCAQRLVVPAGTTVNPWKRIRIAAITGTVMLSVIIADREN